MPHWWIMRQFEITFFGAVTLMKNNSSFLKNVHKIQYTYLTFQYVNITTPTITDKFNFKVSVSSSVKHPVYRIYYCLPFLSSLPTMVKKKFNKYLVNHFISLPVGCNMIGQGFVFIRLVFAMRTVVLEDAWWVFLQSCICKENILKVFISKEGRTRHKNIQHLIDFVTWI